MTSMYVHSMGDRPMEGHPHTVPCADEEMLLLKPKNVGLRVHYFADFTVSLGQLGLVAPWSPGVAPTLVAFPTAQPQLRPLPWGGEPSHEFRAGVTT